MEKRKSTNIVGNIFKRYFVDAMGAMALGLFTSLIAGLILSQLSAIPGLSLLKELSAVVTADSPVVGAAIGVAIAWGLQLQPTVLFSSAVTGAVGYAAGGPVGAYLGAVVGGEIGNLVAGKTRIDIVLTPFVTIITGGLFALFTGKYIAACMAALGNFINTATEWNPIPMGMLVAVVVGMALTMPISSAALCIMIGIDGIAAGAAAVGCCCQMVGFAVASFRDNGAGGLLSQGLGTSMLQVPNIMKKPQIWIAPTLSAAILGPISAALLGMTNTAYGAGMGTSGLVGQFGAYTAMTTKFSPLYTIALILIMHLIAPALLTLGIDGILRKIGWIKKGDMLLRKI